MYAAPILAIEAFRRVGPLRSFVKVEYAMHFRQGRSPERTTSSIQEHPPPSTSSPFPKFPPPHLLPRSQPPNPPPPPFFFFFLKSDRLRRSRCEGKAGPAGHQWVCNKATMSLMQNGCLLTSTSALKRPALSACLADRPTVIRCAARAAGHQPPPPDTAHGHRLMTSEAKQAQQAPNRLHATPDVDHPPSEA